MGPPPPAPPEQPPLNATPQTPKATPLTPKVCKAVPAAPKTPSDVGTPRSTSSVESCWGPGHSQKELTMSTLANCPPNVSKEELAKWWKQKQTKFWRFKKLTGPEADEYRCKESPRVKRVLSRKKGVKDDDNGDNPEDGKNMSLLDADEDDHDSSDMQVK